MKKRLLGILLCCIMLVGMLPSAAFAATEDIKVTSLKFHLNGYEKGKKITAITVSQDDKNEGVEWYGDKYYESPAICTYAEELDDVYYTSFGDESTAVFEGGTDYYLALGFDDFEGYDFSELAKENITLEGYGTAYKLFPVQDGDSFGYIAVFELPQFEEDIITLELPFTKTVTLGGNAEPGKETFKLEIFQTRILPDVMSFQADDEGEEQDAVTYTAEVTTDGKGVFEGKLVITGPESQVIARTADGFLIREVKGNAENWTYSDAVWFVILTEGPDGVGYENLVAFPAELKKDENSGESYYDWNWEDYSEKMAFENIYTLNKSLSPKTGDSGSVILWIGLLLVCVAAIVCVLIGKKKKNNK